MKNPLIRAFAALALLLLPFALPVFAQAEYIPEIPAAPETPEAPQLYEADYGHNITLRGTEEFIYATADLLDALAALPSGAQLLEELGQSGKATRIAAIPSDSKLGPHASPVDFESSIYSLDEDGFQTPASGSDANVFMDPGFQLLGFTPEIVLGHELLHALHFHRGEFLTESRENPETGVMTRLEEYRTIGTDGFDNESISENELRAEWNELHPELQIPLARNGHGATDFGPSRTAGGLATSLRPRARPVSSARAAQTWLRPQARPAGLGAANEGGSQLLERSLVREH